jgi:hypothetical protein
MKKTIIILLILLLGGCTTIERLMLADAKKPEKNVLSEPVAGVTITELDFTKQFPKLVDSPFAALSAFYSESNKLYFSYSEEYSKEDSSAPISSGIYSYDLNTKEFELIIKLDPKEGLYVKSIIFLGGQVFLSGGYPNKKESESPYEIAVIRNGKKEIILNEICNNFRFFPKIYKVNDDSIVFLQYYQRTSDFSIKSGYKITQIFSDLSIKSNSQNEEETPPNGKSGFGYLFSDSVSYYGGFLSFATFKDMTPWLHIASINKTSGLFEEEVPQKIGRKTSPQSIGNIGDNWFITSFGGYENGGWILDVFSHQSGKKIAAQIFDGPTNVSFLDAFNDNTGIFFGNFENDGTHRLPLGIGRLFLGFVEGNTVKYQRIDGLKFNYDPKSITKIADKKYLVKCQINPETNDLSYVVLNIK